MHKVSIDNLMPKQARLVGVAAEAKAASIRIALSNDAEEWDDIARKAHAAADEGFAS